MNQDSIFPTRPIDQKFSIFLLSIKIVAISILTHSATAQAQVPSVKAFYENIISRRQAIADVCSGAIQWNSATGGSYYSYLNQRMQEAWQVGDSVMVNRYKAEVLVARNYCRGIF